jgi:hypothetical protein
VGGGEIWAVLGLRAFVVGFVGRGAEGMLVLVDFVATLSAKELMRVCGFDGSSGYLSKLRRPLVWSRLLSPQTHFWSSLAKDEAHSARKNTGKDDLKSEVKIAT